MIPLCLPTSLPHNRVQNQLIASFHAEVSRHLRPHVSVTLLREACVKSPTWEALIWLPLLRHALKFELKIPASRIFCLNAHLRNTQCSKQAIHWWLWYGYNVGSKKPKCCFVVVPVIVERPDISLVYFKPIYGIRAFFFFFNLFLSKGSIARRKATEHGQSGVM